MSHTGKMQRGKIWHNYRDIDGNYPKEITKDPNKMIDIEYYLKNTEVKTVVTATEKIRKEKK